MSEERTNCPVCDELLVFPRDDTAYCEDCGWPDEYFGNEEGFNEWWASEPRVQDDEPIAKLAWLRQEVAKERLEELMQAKLDAQAEQLKIFRMYATGVIRQKSEYHARIYKLLDENGKPTPLLTGENE